MRSEKVRPRLQRVHNLGNSHGAEVPRQLDTGGGCLVRRVPKKYVVMNGQVNMQSSPIETR